MRCEFIVLYGHRNEREQNEQFVKGHTKLKFPMSKHNRYPSHAIDAAPLPLDWNDRAAFHRFAAIVLEEAEKLGIRIRWGGDWDRDGQKEEPGEWDLPHFELVE